MHIAVTGIHTIKWHVLACSQCPLSCNENQKLLKEKLSKAQIGAVTLYYTNGWLERNQSEGAPVSVRAI